MKRALLAVIATCLVCAGAAHAAPKIHVDEPTYDFGSILEGYVVDHVFVLRNSGDEPLEIGGVSASCGCTTTALATERLAPGESVDLEVLIDTAGFDGRISKSVYVYCNDPEYADSYASERPRFTLRVTGDVIRAQPYHTSISDMNYLFTLLVDLRDPAAFEEAHLTGALNIPIAELDAWLDRLPHDALIILYDQDGQESEPIATDLKRIGYSTAYYVLGGLDEWARWYGTFLLQTSEEGYETPDREGRDHLVCPDRAEAPLCVDVTEIRYLTYLLIDLREPAEYAASHLFGAINIPYTEISARLPDLPKDVLIVLYDQATDQSDAVAQMMGNAGFTQVRSLLGGLDEWIRQFGDRFVLGAE